MSKMQLIGTALTGGVIGMAIGAVVAVAWLMQREADSHSEPMMIDASDPVAGSADIDNAVIFWLPAAADASRRQPVERPTSRQSTSERLGLTFRLVSA